MGLLLAAALLVQPAAAGVTVVPGSELVQRVRTAPEDGPGFRHVTLAQTPQFSTIAIRRTAPERAEVHAAMADVWYVVQGGGTLVTGGALVGAAEVGPGETRGASIAGGEARRIGPGDVVTIAAGVPHWMSGIEGEIVYVLVKVVTPPEKGGPK